MFLPVRTAPNAELPLLPCSVLVNNRLGARVEANIAADLANKTTGPLSNEQRRYCEAAEYIF